MIIKEGFFDRFETSFKLLKKNFIVLVLPLFLYNFVSIVIIGTILQYYLMTGISGISDLKGLDFFSFLNNGKIVLYISVGILFFMIYLLLYVVIFLGILKTIKDGLNGNKSSIIENLKYGLNNFSNSMKTYRYIFAYVALIPSLIFILGGALFNIGYLVPDFAFLRATGLWIIGVSVVIFIVFGIYRWIKSSFGLFSAVNMNEYTKENFLRSTSYIDGQWFRVVGNILLLGLILSTLSSMLKGAYSFTAFTSNGGFDLIGNVFSSIQSNDPDAIKTIITSYLSDFSITSEIIKNLFTNIIKTVTGVFTLIFTYILYLRLGIEYKSNLGDVENSGENKKGISGNMMKNKLVEGEGIDRRIEL